MTTNNRLGLWCLPRSSSNLWHTILSRLNLETTQISGPDHSTNPLTDWKHGPARTDPLPDHNLILTKHPFAQLRSEHIFYLPRKFKLPALYREAKKAATSLERWLGRDTQDLTLAQVFHRAYLDRWTHAYLGWVRELPSPLVVTYESFLHDPQGAVQAVLDRLGEPKQEVPIPGTRVQPQDGPTVTDESFDPTLYTDARWTDWFSQAERDWIAQYINKNGHREVFRTFGYACSWQALDNHLPLVDPDRWPAVWTP